MERLAQLMVRHPVAVGVLMAIGIGWAGHSVYRTGFALGTVRAHQADIARAASESLGG